MTEDQIHDVLCMLAEAKAIAHAATVNMNNLKQHPGFANEQLPELLRAQYQNAMAMIVMAEKIWESVV